MKKYYKILIIWAFCFLNLAAKAQSLYIKSFGEKTGKPVIFLHGGPGYNCANFEATTAKKLSENGFFVIVYDRRGEGRSEANAHFTFDQTFSDIKSIYSQFGLEKATLIGHSFGGIVATLFTEQNPKMVNNIVFVGAPVSLQESFKTIINTCKKIYIANGDSTNLDYIRMLEVMDNTKLEYSSYCFGHAMQNGFYSPKNITEEAKAIYEQLKNDTLKKHASKMTYPGPLGFHNNEKYTTIDLKKNIQKLVSKKVPIYGMYGKDDGLYSPEQVVALQKIIGEQNLVYLDNCSHSVFIDQQTLFIEQLKTWIK